ncbi:uncharacterized protein N7483_011558 [Penicillium malachiteum]|uniref:uncharacterized protein n=1 Tax=Penicillium malachiteum TaxID=1324776 RepID=UPI002546A585|nr:uncharacterized protein N7483_011558 [Penicillium malachiteum]KAJ5714377.1 hypothetical protein N7483_011558 [Penicillium malachiteum]
MTSYLYSPQDYLDNFDSPHTKLLHQSGDSHQVALSLKERYKAFPEADVLNLASVIADLRKASSDSSPHRAAENLHSMIRSVTEVTASFHTKDYSLSSDTVGISIDDLAAHSMRDAIQWWAHWDRSMVDDYWKHIYIAFSTIPEDVAIPPQHLLDGEFRLLGNSLAEMLDGLRKENVSADIIAFMEKCLLQQYLVQYLDKKDPKFSKTIRSDSECRARWRDIMANTYGSTATLMAANKSKSPGLFDTASQMTITMDTLAMELVSNSLIPATVNSQEYRQCLEPEFRGVYLKYMNLLHMIPTAPLLSRYVSSGLHFIPGMDGARERKKKVRFPMSVSLRNKVRSYSQ